MNFSYVVVSISDRCSKNIQKTKRILQGFPSIDGLEFANGNRKDYSPDISKRGIQIRWAPFDGRTNAPLLAELGIWESTIRIHEKVVKDNIENVLVIEDDAVLSEDFLDTFFEICKEIPNDYDFLTLYPREEHWSDHNSDIGKKYIELSYNQYSYFQAVLYSNTGSRKILKNLKRGIEYTSDTVPLEWSRKGLLNGYKVKNEIKIVEHDTSAPSEIDNSNYRYLEE